VRGLFNSAGIQHLQAAVDVPPALWRRVLDINLTGSFLVSAAFARAYAQGRGQENLDSAGASIVLVASMSGRVANRGLQCAAYNASKAGVVQLARNLAMEWGPQGIRVNVGRAGAR
jgi:NAD(P)-dependent dehydrogenase (short-subunit alcohol dehydrogenase family)